MNSNRLGEYLKFDALSAAETLTGESYKTDEPTMALGMLMALDANDRKLAALQANNDTHYSISFDDARSVFATLGFTEVLAVPGARKDHDGDPMDYLIAWADDGILLHCDSYQGYLNGGKMLYNWRPNPGLDIWDFMSSGHVNADGVLVGDHSIVEGLRYNLDRMRTNGTFLNPWVERPFLWLNPTHEDDYQAATESFVQRLPRHVQDAITPKPGEVSE